MLFGAAAENGAAAQSRCEKGLNNKQLASSKKYMHMHASAGKTREQESFHFIRKP